MGLNHISGHDTSAGLQYSIAASLRVTVRSDSLTSIDVSYEGLPAGSRLSVRGPDGQRMTPTEARMPESVAPSGKFTYSPLPAGVYLVELLVQNNASASGASSAGIKDNGKLTVSVR
jgi:hypothetical protein